MALEHNGDAQRAENELIEPAGEAPRLPGRGHGTSGR